VTLKIRTGWAPDRRNGVAIARIAEDCGIAALAVHGRTRACAFKGQAEYDTIAEIKSALGIPVIANGDIDSPAKALAVMQYTGADAIMIGRAAQGRPWLCREIDQYIQTGVRVESPSPDEIKQVLLDHLHALYAFYGEFMGCKIARKHVGWYLKTAQSSEALTLASENSAAFKRFFNTLESPQAQLQAITDYFQTYTELNTGSCKNNDEQGVTPAKGSGTVNKEVIAA
jgi:tRNA-dihydrouridine synthase B